MIIKTSCGSASAYMSMRDPKCIALKSFRNRPKVICVMPMMTDIFICTRSGGGGEGGKHNWVTR